MTSKDRKIRGSGEITIKDIARKLSLSVSTVSRALSDHHHVHDQTKQRVRAAARELGYIPNAAARTMQRTRSVMIGFIVPDVQNEFYATAANIVSARLAEESFQMVLAITDDRPEVDLHHLRALRLGRAAAVAVTLCATPLQETIDLLRQIDVVQFVRRDSNLACPALLIAEDAATMAATRHLIELGHRDIAFIGGPVSLSTGQERLTGYRDALRLASIEPNPSLVALGPPRASFGRAAMLRFAEARPRPTAVLISGYELTLGVVQAASDAGLKFPEDISLIGYGEAGWSRLVGRGLTMIALPVEEMAHAMADLILRRLRNPDDAVSDPGDAATVMLFASSLTVRGSTGRPVRAPAAAS
jgi:DNA-binding LacI/PurR family transcriptional regulator